ncbi:DinB family protein [Reinekea thalattae]|uniref:DinB family protein n=1 Tax=Reinekea thalattae TaxID=2593301 RepID=A0A5C8Z7Y6_9GAMM|nr:DinB family protein [Reinekea thalattae]TXR53757.1 hypothetical protein FME95_04140 [Reinekea thalattae]
MNNLCQANIEALNQLVDLINKSKTIYKTKTDATASIGEHCRHILDHYRAVQKGLENCCIDYNLRTRNSAEETQFESALDNIEQISAWLNNLQQSDYSDVAVISEICLDQEQSETLSSNLDRELLYLLNHSIHHLAYASLSARNLGIELPKHIGLAPGTATYLRHKEAS